MNEKVFQRRLSNLIQRTDAAMEAPQREKTKFELEEMEFLMECTDDQADRAEELIVLHIKNRCEGAR